MVEQRREIGWFGVPERRVRVTDFVGYRCTRRHLDPLYCIKDEQARLSVEDVQPGDIIEIRVSPEVLAVLERQATGTQAVVADMPQPVRRARWIGDLQSALLKQRQLVR
jgi:hypothetical protein